MQYKVTNKTSPPGIDLPYEFKLLDIHSLCACRLSGDLIITFKMLKAFHLENSLVFLEQEVKE